MVKHYKSPAGFSLRICVEGSLIVGKMRKFIYILAGIAILATSCRKYETCATYADSKQVKTNTRALTEESKAIL